MNRLNFLEKSFISNTQTDFKSFTEAFERGTIDQE